jgi:hypothetical protein
MDRATKLYKRYFSGTADEVETSRADQADRVAAIGEWMSRSFHAEFVRLINEIRKSSEPHPGNQEQMLYNIGKRDGVDSVLHLLSSLEREVKESRNAE